MQFQKEIQNVFKRQKIAKRLIEIDKQTKLQNLLKKSRLQNMNNGSGKDFEDISIQNGMNKFDNNVFAIKIEMTIQNRLKVHEGEI